MIKRNSDLSFNFLDTLDIDQEAKRKLSINLSGIYNGSNEVYLTPIGKEHGADNLLLEWDKVFQSNKANINSTLSEIEDAQRLKYGPMSISIPWSERKAGTYDYFDIIKCDYSPLDAAPTALRDKGILRPLSPQNAIKFLKNNTNSGLPFYTRKSIIKDRLLGRFEYYLKREDPCVLFTRTTELKKTRDVWGYPIADSLQEMCYYRPLLEYQKKLSWRSALRGPDETSKKVTSIIKQARSLGLKLISVDFSKFDRSITPDLLSKISEYYKYLYQERDHILIDKMTRRRYSIGLVTPDGVNNDEHCLPSGSTFTNEDDSVGQFTVSRHSGVTFPDLFDIQGDDGIYAVNSHNVQKFFDCFGEFNFIINWEKSLVADDYLVYLQNLFHIDYEKNGVIGGIYPVYRALNRIVHQERWSNFEDYGLVGKDYYAIRTISILENCKHHPLFKELVKFVLKYDKYKLRTSSKGLSDYVRMVKDNSGIEGIIVNQYGDDVKGIRNFETFKLLDQLREA